VRRPAPPSPDPALLDAVPAGLARRARALPTELSDGTLRVRSSGGDDHDPSLDQMRVRVGAADVTAEHDPDAVRHLLAAYARHALPDVLGDAVRLLDTLLDLAVGSDASDIHLEPTTGGIRVRLRIDGDLHEVAQVPVTTVPSLLARVKVRAGLDVAERRLPQDGHLRHELPDGAVDVRVATMPTRDGERATLRLLPAGPSDGGLDGLGLSGAVVAALERAARASDGLVIVCGPTGSGKTTTLHALLTRIAQGRRSVMTLEDPVERVVAGTSQTQVAAAHGLTFADGLRSLLRHDPDVLLVGEVRDTETARLAVEAAQTGHLVLTTLHAIDAPAALTRLSELGVPTGLLADTVWLIVAQRLLALPCPDCSPGDGGSDGDSDTGSGAVAGGSLGSCAGCGGTGTRGRSAIAETLEPDGRLRALLRTGSGPGAHHAALAAAVVPRLRAAALERAAAGRARPADVLYSTPGTDPEPVATLAGHDPCVMRTEPGTAPSTTPDTNTHATWLTT
jgi:type II secretory ATPase GspE/PulE/Tfp pilus assembly ATPase PilB-like protein